MRSRSVAVPGGALQVFDWGSGEPVLFIQTALTADELRPVATHARLDGYRRILYRRRGYAGSGRADAPGSIDREAADGAALLTALGVDRAHLVGLSFSGAIALQLAADAAHLVQSLTLIEPPPVHTPSAAAFRAANDRLIATRRDHGAEVALDEFLSTLIGPDWHQSVDGQIPGATAQMRQDVGTFFDVDLPALLAWQFTAVEAARIGCPVLYVGGSDSGSWFAEVRELMLDWFPHAVDVRIEGAGHSLALSHADQVAAALSTFLMRFPLPERRSRGTRLQP